MERDILPDWQPLDLDDADGEAALTRSGATGEGPGFVAVLTTAGARQGGWAARATSALARAWARERGRVLLADLDLMEPHLHEELGVVNDEGMSDAFLYGASIHRVSRPVEGGFLFAPAGTVVPDPAAVLTSSRWGPVSEAFARVGATLLVHLPAESEGVGSLLARSTDVVLLTRSGEESVVAFGDWGDRVRAVFGPTRGSLEDQAPDGGARGAEGAIAAPAAPPRPDASPAPEEAPPRPDASPAPEEVGPRRDASSAPEEGARWREPASGPDDSAFLDDLFAPPPANPSPAPAMELDDFHHVATPARSGTAPAGAGSGAGPAPAGSAAAPTPAGSGTASAPAGGGGAPEDASRGRGGRTGLLLMLLVLVVIGVALAGWFGLVELPWLPVRDGGADGSPVAAAPAPAMAPTMAYSLELGAYEEEAVADLQAEALTEQRADLLFLVAPVEVDGTVLYRLLAGLAEDSADAVRVRESLGPTLTREDPDGWTIRYTPMAFQLGAFPTLEEARSRVAELGGMGLSSYVLEGAPDASGPFRVYVGAFTNEPESAHMKATLDSLGLRRIPLARRIGRLPDTTE